MTSLNHKKIKVFFSYSHIDEKLRDKLAEHLSLLKRQGIISEWHDREIIGGSNINNEISENLNNADIILLLVSSSFLASDYCYEKEMTRALERHTACEVRVIPVILRPCDWHNAPFGKLLGFPKDGLAVTKWSNEDDAFLDIAQGIRRVAEELQNPKSQQQTDESEEKKKIKIRVELPSPVVSFVQRHDKQGQNFIEKVRQSLSESENRTVVLWGYGGVGKTTLAAQIARSSENKKQIVWISADGRTEISVGVLLDEIATQLGHPEIRQLPPSLKYEQILSLLIETPSLIILDNFETLKSEYQTECLSFLKTHEFESLITTRYKINEVKNINVFEMTELEANSYLNRLLEDSTLLNAFTKEIQQRIIETTERNPLVMQWVVGQIDAAQSPEEVFEELKHGESDAAERVFNRSFNLPQLGDDGRSVLLTLSLFALSARRKSVKSIVKIGDNKRFNQALENIANLRLINVTDGSERLFLGGSTRLFARAYLEKKDNYKSYCQRFIRYFENFVRIHAKLTSDNLNLLEEERVNLFTAIELAFECKNWQRAVSISTNLSPFLDTRGHWEDLIRICKKMLDLPKRTDKKQNRSFFIEYLGIAHTKQGDIENAEHYLKENLENNKKLGNQSGIAVSSHNLGNIAKCKGDIDEAEQFYNKSLEIHRKLGNEKEIAGLLNNFGNLARTKGNMNKAEDFYNESLAINRKIRNQPGIAANLHNLGNLAKDRGDAGKAIKLCSESLEIDKELGKLYGIASTLISLGEIHFFNGNIDESEMYCSESIRIFENLKHIEGINENRRLIGQIFQSRGDFKRAEDSYQESLNNFQKLGYKEQIALTLKELASLAEAKGEQPRAAKFLKEALQIFEKLGSPKANEVRSNLERLEITLPKEN
jgi:tetratricopeptide (TPR) repeat protein